MPLIEVAINSKMYQIGCADGEQEYVTKVLRNLNNKITKLKRTNPAFANLKSDQLFLYQLILLSNEIDEIKDKQKCIKEKASKQQQAVEDKNIANLESSISKLQKTVLSLEEMSK